MALVDGGELLVRTLRRHGIDTVFTLHGGHLDAFYQAALDHDLRLVDTRHEQAAGHAADGWARTTRRPGVAVVTAGPGVTDVVTGVANAHLDAVPVLVIGGAAPLSDAEMLPLQGGLDQVELMRPVTKWSHRITHTERIPDLVTQALRVATSGRPGPVFLEIPIDVLFRRLDDERVVVPSRVGPEMAPAPPPAAVEQLLDLLAAAERPVVLAGGGALFSGTTTELVALAERLQVPVLTNGKARGLVPDDHPLCGGGFQTLDVAATLGQRPDLVVVLGTRLGLFTGGRSGSTIPAEAHVVQVDVEAEEIGRNRDVELGIVADVRETLRALLAASEGPDRPAWPDRSAWLGVVAQARDLLPSLFAPTLTDDAAIHPYRLAHVLASLLDDDAIVVADGGETAWWMGVAATVRRPASWLTHGYLGCLGVGLPFALAAKAAHPDRQVVCISGDGSIGLNFSEFDTMVRHGLPVVTVVNNDQQWGMSRHGQELLFGPDRTVVTALGPTRYDLAAAGFGCHAELVESAAELEPALRRALAAGKPACVNVLTDPTVIAPITMALVGAGTQVGDGQIRLPYYGDRDG